MKSYDKIDEAEEFTCVFIEHAHSVVDITRMPGWVSDHSVVPSHTKGETNEKKSVGALKHRRTFALLFCQSKNQTITESDAPRGSQHQQAPELWRDQCHLQIPHQW